MRTSLSTCLKKIFNISLLILVSLNSNAQRAVFKNNTIIYAGKTYAAGDTIKLQNGSQTDKSFAYVNAGSDEKALKELDRTFANTEAIIEKVSIQRKTVYINARLVGKTTDAVGANKIFVDFEPAIDSEEIVLIKN